MLPKQRSKPVGKVNKHFLRDEIKTENENV